MKTNILCTAILLFGIAGCGWWMYQGSQAEEIYDGSISEWDEPTVGSPCPVCGRETICKNVSWWHYHPNKRTGAVIVPDVLLYDYWCPYCEMWLSRYETKERLKAEKEELEWYRDMYPGEYEARQIWCDTVTVDSFAPMTIPETIEHRSIDVSLIELQWHPCEIRYIFEGEHEGSKPDTIIEQVEIRWK